MCSSRTIDDSRNDDLILINKREIDDSNSMLGVPGGWIHIAAHGHHD
jgi:hypothetical protein